MNRWKSLQRDPEILRLCHRRLHAHQAEHEVDLTAVMDFVVLNKQYLQAQGNPIANSVTSEAWLLPKANNPVWMVIFLSSSSDMPGTVVYVQAVTGEGVKSRPFLRRA